jgi:V-type H+-transporting ATPase subunit a
MGEINDNLGHNINQIVDETEPLLENDDLHKAENEFVEELRKSSENLFQNIEKEREETATDIFVHQIIETIEFVLGCVSNTASYLRLWALSLAHSQLSKVFFEKSLFGLALSDSYFSFILVIIGYFIFAHITIFVLMGMDLLEASLHTLRLHWVEFQNKFYYADGTQFIPYSFDLLLESDK